jgi:hypothetical protein
MALDLDAITARLRQASRVEPPPARPLVPPPVTGPASRAAQGAPAPEPSTPPAAASGVVAPEGPTRRRPKRRRWVMPSSPAERRAETVDPPASLYRCPYCGRNHQSIPMGGGGAAAAYARPLDHDPYAARPAPLGHGPADTSSLVRDRFSVWRASPAAEPIPPALTFRERVARLWYGGAANP